MAQRCGTSPEPAVEGPPAAAATDGVRCADSCLVKGLG